MVEQAWDPNVQSPVSSVSFEVAFRVVFANKTGASNQQSNKICLTLLLAPTLVLGMRLS